MMKLKRFKNLKYKKEKKNWIGGRLKWYRRRINIYKIKDCEKIVMNV